MMRHDAMFHHTSQHGDQCRWNHQLFYGEMSRIHGSQSPYFLCQIILKHPPYSWSKLIKSAIVWLLNHLKSPISGWLNEASPDPWHLAHRQLQPQQLAQGPFFAPSSSPQQLLVPCRYEKWDFDHWSKMAIPNSTSMARPRRFHVWWGFNQQKSIMASGKSPWPSHGGFSVRWENHLQMVDFPASHTSDHRRV